MPGERPRGTAILQISCADSDYGCYRSHGSRILSPASTGALSRPARYIPTVGSQLAIVGSFDAFLEAAIMLHLAIMTRILPQDGLWHVQQRQHTIPVCAWQVSSNIRFQRQWAIAPCAGSAEGPADVIGKGNVTRGSEKSSCSLYQSAMKELVVSPDPNIELVNLPLSVRPGINLLLGGANDSYPSPFWAASAIS